mgnify:CR=1 FL=1
MNSFSGLSASLLSILRWITEFMKELSPVYFMAVAAASGASTAVVFYQGVLLLVWLFQWILESVLLPGVSLYILLKFVNHLSREEMLGKMAELIETLISWGLRTLLGVVAGLQVVRGLVTPVMDSLKRSAIGKTAGTLPGVGNAVQCSDRLVLTTAVLVRNSLGVVFLLVFLVVGASPVIRYGLLALVYRFLAAVAQPVSDKRLVEVFSTMGEGCALLMRILFTAEVFMYVDISDIDGRGNLIMRQEIYQWMKDLAFFMCLLRRSCIFCRIKRYEQYVRLFMGLLLILLICTPVFAVVGKSQELLEGFRKNYSQERTGADGSGSAGDPGKPF